MAGGTGLALNEPFLEDAVSLLDDRSHGGDERLVAPAHPYLSQSAEFGACLRIEAAPAERLAARKGLPGDGRRDRPGLR
jgi:hypothetical protein